MFALIFGQAWDQMGQKFQHLAQNDHKCILYAKFGHFGAKNANLNGRKQKFWIPRNGKTTKAPCWSVMRPNGSKMPKIGQKYQF